MVGVCGRIGGDFDVGPLVDWIEFGGETVTAEHSEGRFEFATSFHRLLAGDQPASASHGDVDVWVWGDVYGHGSGTRYEPRDGSPDGSAAYCARLYDEHGPGFVSELNGGYLLVVLDRERGAVSFVTDRFATRPVYYCRPDGDCFLFASNLQSLSCHPAMDASFVEPYLQEYLTLRRVFGVKTPVTGVSELPPGSVTTIDLDARTTSVERYWAPHYDPIDRPFSHYQDRFTETIKRVLTEWTRDDLEYGLLLSGGSDSRLVQAAIDRPVTAFHAAGWMSREARIARRSAEARGDEFRLLRRDEEHVDDALATNPSLSNFSGWFDQAYFLTFSDQIVSEVDVLVSGLYADMLFAGAPLPTWGVSLGPIGNVTLPVNRSIDTVEDYVAAQTEEAVEPVPYLRTNRSVGEVLAENVTRNSRGVESHGVQYGSLCDLVMYGDYYPMGADTDAIFSRSLMHLRPYRTPFLDNRLVDLQQRMPTRYFLRRNVVKEAVGRIEPALAEIPHAGTGVPLKYPFPVEYVGGNLNGFRRKHLFEEPPPAAHLDHGPWPNRRELLRVRDFAERSLREHEDLARALDFLDYDGAMECYREHVDGADNSTLLYSLLTLLAMPVTEQVCRSSPITAGDGGQSE